jgi:hypothetical protein
MAETKTPDLGSPLPTVGETLNCYPAEIIAGHEYFLISTLRPDLSGELFGLYCSSPRHALRINEFRRTQTQIIKGF